MARQNIEEEWWSDPRRGRLITKIGCAFKADGIMVNAWKLAERFWRPYKSLIPFSAWDDSGLPDELFECKLAERRADGVYIRGSQERFEWWFEGIEQRREAGRKSAEVRKEKFGSAIPENASNETERPLNENRTEPNETEPSSSISSSKKEYIYTPEFESVWAKYNQGSKQQAFDRFQKHISPARIEDFQKSVDNYLDECRQLNRFLKDVATFIGTGKGKSHHFWLEYIDKKTTTAKPASLLPSDPPCNQCDKGLIRAVKASNGQSEYVRCTCPRGRRRQGEYACWDAQKFQRAS